MKFRYLDHESFLRHDITTTVRCLQENRANFNVLNDRSVKAVHQRLAKSTGQVSQIPNSTERLVKYP